MSDQERDYAVVMRMEGMWPENIGGYEGHRTRKGGDIGHVDRSRSHLNTRLIGSASWAQEVQTEISEMRMTNFADELEKLEKRRRPKDIAQRLAEGPRDPWRATRHGPLREVILTANRKWFDNDLTKFFGESGPTREQQFEELAVAWLRAEFGDDCVHARADQDEDAYHVHAVIVPRTVTADGRRMLQPSKHAVILNYEDGQDSVGAWFEAADIGLVRGERRKQQIREALEHNASVRKAQADAAPGEVVAEPVPVPEHRRHVSPRKWRDEQERILAARDKTSAAREAAAKERDLILDSRTTTLDARDVEVGWKEAEADAVLAVACDVAEGRLDPRTAAADAVDSPDPQDRDEKVSMAKRIFGRALATLRQRAQAEARAELAGAFAEIEAADRLIVDIVRMLPANAREAVASVRKSLTGRIMILSKMAKDWLGKEQDDDREE